MPFRFIRMLTRGRPPRFTFAFDEVLFRFQYDSPALAPLFQFPPHWASTHTKPLYSFHFIALRLGVIPQTPLQSFFKKPAAQDHARVRRGAAQVPARQPRTGAAVPAPAPQGNALTARLIVVVLIS